MCYPPVMADRLQKLRTLYEADPSDPFAAYAIGLELAKSGATEEALAWLDAALEADPAYHYARFQKGRVLADAGRTDEARAALDAGIEKARAAGDPEAQHAAEEMAGLKETL